MAATERPDLILMDAVMPGLDGYELAQIMKGDERFKGIPIIMITSSDDKHRAVALEAGVSVLLGKPYEEEALIAHIETLLTKEIDGKYIKQMQWQMACTGRQWVDFVSFDPRMPADMQLFIKRVVRDDKAIAAVISRTAYHNDAVVIGKAASDLFGDGAAGILHQREGGHARLNGQRVGTVHLVRGQQGVGHPRKASLSTARAEQWRRTGPPRLRSLHAMLA